MKLTRASEYALLALLYIGRRRESGYIALSEIAKKQGLPGKYMESLMHILCRAEIVSSSKGRQGGYQLARSPEMITVAQIIRLMDGPLAPVASVSVHFYKPTVIEREKKLTGLMRGIRDYIANKLEKATLKDLL